MKIRMEEKSFEENMEQLEKIVTELEKGDLNLDESVKKFEQGMKTAALLRRGGRRAGHQCGDEAGYCRRSPFCRKSARRYLF